MPRANRMLDYEVERWLQLETAIISLERQLERLERRGGYSTVVEEVRSLVAEMRADLGPQH